MYTAWWYDNGNEKTVNQLEWRLKMLEGIPDFRLINITSNSFDNLMMENNAHWNRDLFAEIRTTAVGY